MKNLIISGLSAVAFTSIVTPSFAQEAITMKSGHAQINEVAPITLVQLAYQGYFKNQGIPSGGRFTAEANSGDIDAKMLVQSAIERGRLSPDTLNDRGYLNIVETELKSLDNG